MLVLSKPFAGGYELDPRQPIKANLERSRINWADTIPE
jgi:hypothetical protein